MSLSSPFGQPHFPISFIDLPAQQRTIRTQIDAAIKKVLDHGIYIMGPEVAELETELSRFCGAKYTLSCSNGTDALGLGLMAYGVKSGDAVFVPSFTFAATAEVVLWMGATPLFVDCLEDTYTIDPVGLEQAILRARELGLNPAGIIPVDLFGQPADYEAIQTIAETHQLWVMADAAQSFGASYNGRPVGTMGDLTTTSFFPAKPLGCYGDGGAVFTDREDLIVLLRSLRVHGQGSDKYDNIHIGINGRLDTLQAAILLEKIKVFRHELSERQKVADFYTSALKDIVVTPYLREGSTSSWAQYTVQLSQQACRTSVMKKLHDVGIPTVIYYPKPLHLQTAYRECPTGTGGGLPVCERLAHQVMSLPMSGYIMPETLAYIAEHVYRCVKEGQ